MSKKKTPKPRNYTVIALALRHGGGDKAMRDRRSRRQNRQSWRQDVDEDR